MPPASRKTRSQNAYRLARRATVALCHPFDTPAAPPAGPDAASTSAPQAVPTASSCAPTRRSSPAPLSVPPPERQSVSRHSCSDLPRGADPRFVAPFAVVAQSAAERPMRRSLSAHQGALTSPTRGIEQLPYRMVNEERRRGVVSSECVAQYHNLDQHARIQRLKRFGHIF